MGKVLSNMRPGGMHKLDEDVEMANDKKKQMLIDRAEKRKERNSLEEYFVKEFMEIIGTIPQTTKTCLIHLAQFDQLLQHNHLNKLEKLVKDMEFWDAPNTIPEPKSFLYYAHLQPVMVQMLKDTEKYQDYLERFINRFQAENELTRPKTKLPLKSAATNLSENENTAPTQNPESNSDPTQPSENENSAPQNIPQSESPATKLSAPIHYAVLQLNESFLEWLLQRSNTDVNLRDNYKRTALMLLCENYNQCMRPSKKPYPTERLEKIQKFIKLLLEAGADFNICSTQIKLPFELLLKNCDKEGSFIEQCVLLAQRALAICNIIGRGERVVEFFQTQTEKNFPVKVTVELLEIFLRFNDSTNFHTYMKNFEVNETNVKKVIRLLLHTACDQKLFGCVRLILDRGGQHIFNVVQSTRKQLAIDITNERTATSSSSVVVNSNDATNEPAVTRSSQVDNPQSNEQARGRKEQKVYELEHRVELKGLLKKICLMADLSLLQRFLAKISDLIVLNDDPLLVHTLRKAYYSKHRIQEQKALLACAEHLATQETIHMSKKDNSGNTSLHLALKYGFDSVARLLLRQRYAYLGMRNKDNLTPLDYGTYEFWKNYFDTCIEVDWKRSIPDRDEIRFNLNGFYTPLQEKVGTNPTAKTVGTNPTSCCKKLLQMVKANTQPQNPTNTVTEMTILQQIAQSKDLKRLLLHPVLNTFIMVKWTRLCQWNFLNLVLTTLTTLSFGYYSLIACSIDGPSTKLLVLSSFGVMFVAIRELLQYLFLRRSYLSFENVLDIVNTIVMFAVLVLGCNGLMSSFVIISLAMQLTFLMGSVQSTQFVTIMYMFKTVSINFLISFSFFLPLILAFIYAFHLSYNQSPERQEQVCDKDDCAEDNFNNFRTFWNATVKTLVMTTGEFEAAALDFEDGKVLLFLVFLFIAPIVILNLINGLAVSDIAAIREESELISISKKVMLLEQYERGVANVRPVFLKRFFPKPFFSEYQSRIHVKTKDNHKIVVHPKPKPKEQVKTPQGSNSAPAKDVQKNSKNRQNGSPKCAVLNTQNGQKASNGNPQNGSQNAKELEKPIPKFPWLYTCDTRGFISKTSYLREALFMYLDQAIMDEALVIVAKQNGYASHFASKGSSSSGVPFTPETQHSKPLGSSTKQRIDKKWTQSEDDVLRELTDAKEQLKAVLEMQEHLKKVLGELMRCKEYQDMQKDVIGQDKQEDVVGQDKQEDDASKQGHAQEQIEEASPKGAKEAITQRQMGG